MHKILWAVMAVCLGAIYAQGAAASTAYTTALKRDHFSKAIEIAPTPALRTYAHWRLLRSGYADPTFAEVSQFMSQYPEWPDRGLLQQHAERALFHGYASAAEARAWLERNPPVSGYGKLLAARIGMGDAASLAREGWISGDFDKTDEPKILSEFAPYLNRDAHQARIERLLRDDRASIAERLLGRVSAEDAALYRARIALIRKDRGVEGLVNKVPPARLNDDGLLADRAIWRDAKGLESGVIELLLRMHPQSAHAMKLWPLRAKHAREMIEQRRYGDAVAILDNMGKLEGAHLADALWLRGWLRLEFMHEPARALELFSQLYDVVNFPVSKARAAYWAGRAAEKSSPGTANDWYRKAAEHPTVFYGQLAYAKIHPGEALRFPSAPSHSEGDARSWSGKAIMLAARDLTRIGEPNLADTLIRHLAESAKSDSELAAIVVACQMLDMRFAQVRAAKTALQKGVVMLDHGWPMVRNPEQFDIELPLAYAISRQESEFNPRAVSMADARGLMQLLPSTARTVARKLGIGYDASRLFDPNYNMRLGTHYLGNLISGFDGSYILAVAGYNAGPGRSRQWTDRFGRPGYDLHQTVNWMEMIPFGETRNYVQRVLENLQVYRARLKPDAPLAIETDIKR